jgi:DNA topoisomerase III
MSKWLVIAEKPSVALDYAKAMGPFENHDSGSYYETSNYLISYAVGHLLELVEPESYNPDWKRWSLGLLPMLPEEFKYRPRDKKAQTRLKVLKKLAKRKDVVGVVNGCDAGREGEHIFRTIFPQLGRDLPTQRIWLSSMTTNAIKGAFKNLRAGSDYDGLADAASCRAEADWLIGMNATRALTRRLKSFNYQGAWSVGRVQTPTLAMVALREIEIMAHRPKTFWEIRGLFDAGDHQYESLLHVNGPEEGSKPTRIFDAKKLAHIQGLLAQNYPTEATETRKKSRERAPLPYDLTSLQKSTGMTAKSTQDIAQALYERHKVTSYPRTDSRHLPQDHLPMLDEKLGMLKQSKMFAPVVELIEKEGAQNLERVYDDKKLTDHHAIVPVAIPSPGQLNERELRVYSMIVRQYLASMMPVAIWSTVQRHTRVNAPDEILTFLSKGRMLAERGWQAAMGKEVGHGSTLKELSSPEGQAVTLASSETTEGETKPRARFTDATLVSRMENCGKEVDDEELSAVLKDRGLGTPATRADTIERLIGRGYLARGKQGVRATAKALRLIEVLDLAGVIRLTSAELTGDMERKLRAVESQSLERQSYMGEVRANTVAMIESLVGFDFEELFKADPIGHVPGFPDAVVSETAWGYSTPEGSEEVFFVWKDIGGRMLSRADMKDLLEKESRQIGPVTLYPRMAVKSPGYQANLNLERLDDEAYEKLSPTKSKRPPSRWRVQIENVGGSNDIQDEDEKSLGTFVTLPDGLEVIETNLRYADEEFLKGAPKPKALLPKLVCDREITPEEAKAYFMEGETELLGGFKSKKGRFFKAKLILKPNGRHGFEFAPRR